MNYRLSHLTAWCTVIFLISIAILWRLMALMSKSGISVGAPVDMEITGQVGDYIGGTIGTLFAGAGFWLLIITLREQIQSSKLNEFDNLFSKMLMISQQNISQMEVDARQLLPDKDKLYIELRVYCGKDVFQLFYYQFVTCRNELSPILTKSDKIYTKDYEKAISENENIKTRRINIYELAKIDICYSIVFFGTNSEGRRILTGLFKGRYRERIIEKILKLISLKPAFDEEYNKRWLRLDSYGSPRNLIEHVEDIYSWRVIQTIRDYLPKFEESKGYRSDFVKYYNGFHQILGHYYRHLYQLVNSVDKSQLLDEKSKYEKIKLIRGQMSNYDQIVFFLNSLSIFGRIWELDTKVSDKQKSHRNLITRYKLIKNIPTQSLFGIDIKKYYPEIKFETFDI